MQNVRKEWYNQVEMQIKTAGKINCRNRSSSLEKCQSLVKIWLFMQWDYAGINVVVLSCKPVGMQVQLRYQASFAFLGIRR
jgi:hypothetical protein